MSDGLVGFALRAGYDLDTFGGVLAYGNERTSFDVGKELRENGGQIVTDDVHLVSALDNYPALKRARADDSTPPVSTDETPHPEAEKLRQQQEEQAGTVTSLNELDVPTLLQLARKKEVALPSSAPKPRIVDALAPHVTAEDLADLDGDNKEGESA